MPVVVLHHHLPQVANDPNDWYPDYPNPADFQFDYYKLLDLAAQNNSGIGYAPNDGSGGPSVAIIGAGAAGMTAARELFRCGYKVTMYEASDRICGRHYTVPVPGHTTAFELGAMRFPFFSAPGAKNSVFEYYLSTEGDALLAPFPNPGAAPGNTGIYMNQGFGPNNEFYPERKMIVWPPNVPPPDPQLAPIYKLVNDFVTFFTTTVGGTEDNPGPYGTAAWPGVWEQIANQYDKMTFSDLVFSPAITEYNDNGWLGGFGMNDAQSQLFYTIGAGDGSWGAFYEISAMWFIRCVMFGFNSSLQTVIGLNDAASLPYYNDAVFDSGGKPLAPPLYQGIQSLVEWLLYNNAPGAGRSFYSALNDGSGDAGLFTGRGVVSVAQNDGAMFVTDVNGTVDEFDYVIMTPQIWASELGIDLVGFNPNDLPQTTLQARDEQHIIASCKVFFPLNEPYWTNGASPNDTNSIPQVIITDTFVQDAYGLQWSPNDAGVLLASYTWEDDALKLLAYSDADVAAMVLAELDRITMTTRNGQRISDYVNANDALVFHWTQQLGYNGCAKLYRQRNWTLNYSLLAYNQENAKGSKLYLAGETFSVEGGWTEPALRLALDAVIRLIQNSGGTFVPGFDVDNDYPSFDVGFTPDYSYNVPNDA
jgi:tryptophan 2-monooxygenase